MCGKRSGVWMCIERDSLWDRRATEALMRPRELVDDAGTVTSWMLGTESHPTVGVGLITSRCYL